MTKEELAGIKARWERILSSPRNPVIASAHAVVDVPKLLEEVERLQRWMKKYEGALVELRRYSRRES